MAELSFVERDCLSVSVTGFIVRTESTHAIIQAFYMVIIVCAFPLCRFSAALLWSWPLHCETNEREVPHESHREATRCVSGQYDRIKCTLTHH